MPLTLRSASASMPLAPPTTPRRAATRRRAPRPAGPPSLLHSDPFQFDQCAERMFGAARDALVVIDLHTDRIARWNPAAELVFGYAAGDAIGKSIQSFMPRDLAQLHRERMAHYVRSGEREILFDRRPVTTPVLHQTGAELKVEMSVVPLDPPPAAPRWVLLAFRDAACHGHTGPAASSDAARGESEAWLCGAQGTTPGEPDAGLRGAQRTTWAAAEEVGSRGSAAALGASLADVGVPIARARRAVERLSRFVRDGDTSDGIRLKRLAALVEARTRDAQRALEDLGVAESIQHGTFELQMDRVNLVPLANRVVAEMRRLAPLHRIKLGAPQGLTAMCDAGRVETVLADLIKRAVRRNPRGCWIDVDLRRPLAGVAEIAVRDYGRQLAEPERRRRMADRGWFIDRHIAEQHGGTLTVEYPREGGVRVALRLPMHRGRLIARR